MKGEKKAQIIQKLVFVCRFNMSNEIIYPGILLFTVITFKVIFSFNLTMRPTVVALQIRLSFESFDTLVTLEDFQCIQILNKVIICFASIVVVFFSVAV